MRRHILFPLILSSLLYTLEGVAYELGTHEKLSAAAAKNSTLSSDTRLLKNLGLQPSIEDYRNIFPNSEGKPKNILNLIKDGARFEDGISPCDSRPGNHFYNPLNGSGLKFGVIKGSPSSDWTT